MGRPPRSRGGMGWARSVPARLLLVLLALATSFEASRARGFDVVSQEDSVGRLHRRFECPSNCSSRGHCIMGKCYCLFGYAGENCAIVSDVVLLKPGGSYRAHITSKSWRYFTVNVADSNPGHLQVELLALANVSYHHGASEGLELRSQLAMFVNNLESGLPDEANFESRCLQRTDCAKSNKLELRIEEPQGSTWSIGVRSGLKDEYFSIGVETPLGLCSDSCSGRGVCLRGRCCCRPGAHGAKCEDTSLQKSVPVALNSEVPGNIGKDAWRYYLLSQMRSTSAFHVTLKILSFSRFASGGQSVHLVVNKSNIPTTSADRIAEEYELSCRVTKQQITDAGDAECSIRVDKPGPFAWFVGILADGLEANYVLETQSVDRCPHGCNLNGKCNADLGKCFCYSNYTGSDCHQPSAGTSLALGTSSGADFWPESEWLSKAQGFFLRPNEANYHKILVSREFADNLNVHIERVGEAGGKNDTQEVSVHVQNGVLPTADSFLLRKTVATGKRTVLSVSPTHKAQNQIVWLRVTSPGPSMYTLVAERAKTQCKHDCNGQGFCYKGVCQCHPGYAGISCGYHLATKASEVTNLAASEDPPSSTVVILAPYKWFALNVDETFPISDHSRTYFQLELELQDEESTKNGVLGTSPFSCEDLAAIVYYNDKVESLDHQASPITQRQGEGVGACLMHLGLKQNEFKVARIELLWQHNDFFLAKNATDDGAGGEFGGKANPGRTFRLAYGVVKECPNKCSGAGTCKKGVCMCSHDRTGPDYSQIKPQLIAYEQIVPTDLDNKQRGGGEYEEYEEYSSEDESRPHGGSSSSGEYGGSEGGEGLGKSPEISYDDDEEDGGYLRMDRGAMSSGYVAIGSIFVLISCLTVYMRYSDRQKGSFFGPRSPKPQRDDDTSGEGAPVLRSYASAGRKHKTYRTMLDRVDEEENFPAECHHQHAPTSSFGSPKTTLTNIQLPLPNVMKGPQMRQRKTSWGMLSESNGYETYQEKLSPKAHSHISIQIPTSERPV